MTKPLPIAVLISGGGTTLRNLIRQCASGQLSVSIQLVISSNPAAAGLQFAADAGIATQVVERRPGVAPESFRDAIFEPCRAAGAEIVVMGGFLKHVLIPPDFENRVVNIHPSLIPAFCGKGFYGLRVHEAVLEYGARLTGCTVHFVDNQYDHGPIISQHAVPVSSSDDAETLQQRVFAAECQALPAALQLLAEQRISVENRTVHIAE